VKPVIVPDHLADNKTPDVKELASTAISDKTVDGPEGNVDVAAQPVTNEKAGGTEIVQPIPIEPEIYAEPEVQPEFPGGITGWMRFLQRNLKAPDENGDINKITVIIKFVVNEDGSLTNMEIVKSGGSVFDEEVLRVMKKSPKWVAGSNHGKKVKVYHSQPVIFVYEQEQ
jgi:protein TonB